MEKQKNNLSVFKRNDYNPKRMEKDLYDCAVWHYTIEKINNKEASKYLDDDCYWRFKTRYKDILFIETSDKNLNEDKIALTDIIVKVRMKIDEIREENE